MVIVVEDDHFAIFKIIGFCFERKKKILKWRSKNKKECSHCLFATYCSTMESLTFQLKFEFV